MKLRLYQSSAVDALLACVQRRRNPLYVLPTGGGKSVVIARVIAVLAGMGCKVCVAAHREELVSQLSAALTVLGVEHGIIASGHELTAHPVHVASIATLDRRRMDPATARWLLHLDLLVLDEAHHVAAGQWMRVIAAARRAVHMGCTATPFRLDGRGLGDVFDEPVRGPSVRELVRLGYLAPLHVYAPPVDLAGLGSVGKSMGDYKRRDLSRVVNTPEVRRAALRYYFRWLAGRQALAFCVDLEHVADLDGDFDASGWHAASVDGSMSTADRRAVIAAMRAGATQVLSSCELIGEGFDVPAAGGALLLRPTMSTGLFLQQVGRAARPVYAPDFDPRQHDGHGMGDRLARLGAMARGPKPAGIIVDLVGNVTRHGMPDADRPWTLEGGVKGLERQVPPTRRCRHCYRVVAVGPESCPGCGRAYGAAPTPPRPDSKQLPLHLLPGIGRHTAADLAEMKHHEVMALAETPEHLKAIEVAKGYGRGWADRAWRHLLGEGRATA